MPARVRQRKTAGRERVPLEKVTRERKRIGKIGSGRRLGVRAQESRQRHELVAVGFARFTRDRAARSRRNVDKIVRGAGHHTGRQIQPETEFGEEGEFEIRDLTRGDERIIEAIEDRFKHGMDAPVRLALGEQPAQRRKMRHAMHGVRRREKAGRAQVEALDRVVTEMFVEPRPPCG